MQQLLIAIRCMRHRFRFVMPVLCCFIAGCGSMNKASDNARVADAKTDTSTGALGLLREAARAMRIARAYDAGLQAARRDDEAAFVERCRQLRALRAMPEALSLASSASVGKAEKAVSAATALEGLAQQARREQGRASGESSSKATPEALRFAAARQYRRALELSPAFDSPDAAKLNALAYFLAERGANQSDFTAGEALARRAISLLDEAIAQGPARGYRTQWWLLSRTNTRDTLAWALFRRGRFAQALREQQNAVKESDDTWRAIARLQPPNTPLENGAERAELLFHLGEILRALGRTSQARTQLQAALKADPTHAQSRESLRVLNLSAPAKPLGAKPSP